MFWQPTERPGFDYSSCGPYLCHRRVLFVTKNGDYRRHVSVVDVGCRDNSTFVARLGQIA